MIFDSVLVDAGALDRGNIRSGEWNSIRLMGATAGVRDSADQVIEGSARQLGR